MATKKKGRGKTPARPSRASKKSKTAASARKRLGEAELVRLTALQLAVLGSIESAPKREQYGSAVIRDVTADLALEDLPLATVYTALRRLEERGLLTSRWGPPGKGGGNNRRFYKSTPAARRAFKDVARALAARAGIR